MTTCLHSIVLDEAVGQRGKGTRGQGAGGRGQGAGGRVFFNSAPAPGTGEAVGLHSSRAVNWWRAAEGRRAVDGHRAVEGRQAVEGRRAAVPSPRLG